MQDRIVAVINRIGDIAASVQDKLRWFVGLGGIASVALAWKLYSEHSAVWWNLLKCGLVCLPVLVWLLVWYLLSQLREAPQLVMQLAHDDQGVFANLDEFSVREPSGLRGLFSTVRAFRREEGLSVIFDTISGIGLMVNPLFAFIAFVCMLMVWLLILVAPLVWLF